MTVPAWFRIVKDYPGLRVGPTLPFVLGAIRDPIGKAPDSRVAGQRELHSLLRAMHDQMPAGYGVRIQWCPGTKAYVAACFQPGTSFTWDGWSFSAVGTVDALVAKLWELYGDEIAEGKYSKNGNWHPLTATELKMIREILAAC